MVGFMFRGKVYVGQYRGRDKMEINKRQHIIAFPSANIGRNFGRKELSLSEFMVSENELIPLVLIRTREMAFEDLPNLPAFRETLHKESKRSKKPAKGRN